MVNRLNYWVYFFISFHVFIWTLAPTLTRHTLPLDAMEGATWGHQLQWGYDKNPFMNGALTHLAIWLGGQSGWMTYLFCQLSVAACFWAVWRLGKQIMPPVYAFIAILLLEGIQYYNFHAIDFNDNTLELGFWALTTLFFYQAVHRKNLSNWVLTGIFAACCMMTKYYSVVLLLPMLFFLIINDEASQNFTKPPLYIGLAIFIILITPHIIWLFANNFITVNYAFDRVSTPPTLGAHFYFPALFTWQIMETLLPGLLLFFVLCTAKTLHTDNIKMIFLKSSDKVFLLLIGLGPFIITVLLALSSGIKLRSGWGQPLLSLWGLILLMYLRPTISQTQLYRFICFICTGIIASAIIYAAAFSHAKKPSSANFPGKEVASALTNIWHEKYHTQLEYTAGLRWIAGNIAFYSKDQPAVYIEWNKNISPWINENMLEKSGAIFAWDLSENKNIPFDEIKKRFPKLEEPQIMQFDWLHNNKNFQPVKIMIAFLPPETLQKPEVKTQLLHV